MHCKYCTVSTALHSRNVELLNWWSRISDSLWLPWSKPSIPTALHGGHMLRLIITVQFFGILILNVFCFLSVDKKSRLAFSICLLFFPVWLLWLYGTYSTYSTYGTHSAYSTYSTYSTWNRRWSWKCFCISITIAGAQLSYCSSWIPKKFIGTD